MANEFKVRKGLIVNGSGSVILDIQGSQGQLFSVTDQLSGSLFSVNDISGMPILGVSSDDSVRLGTFNREAIIVSGSNARITGSLFGTASWASNAITASNALTSSFVLNAVSASFASTASFVLNAVSSSFSQTASFVLNAVSSSFAATASSADSFVVRQNATASNLLVNNTITAQTLVVQTITSSVDFVTGSTRFGSLLTNTHQFTGSVSITGSLTVTGVATINNLTGSLFGTSSWANNATTSSYALTASFFLGFVGNATASFTNQSTWTFNHNLNNQNIVIQTYDTSYNQIIPQNIQSTNANTATITFPLNVSGYAVASIGGGGAGSSTTSTGTSGIVSFNLQTSSYVLAASDAGKIVRINSGSAATVTLPDNTSVPIVTGSLVTIEQTGAGFVTAITGSGVTILPTARTTSGQYTVIQVYKVDTNTWNVLGGIV